MPIFRLLVPDLYDMDHKVIIKHINATEAVERKNQLLTDGLIIDQDFVWEYSPAAYDNDGFTAVTPRQVTFKFATASMATFYKLKWI